MLALPVKKGLRTRSSPSVLLACIGVAAVYAAIAWAIFGGIDHWPGSSGYRQLSKWWLLMGKGYSLDGQYPTAQRAPLYPLILGVTMLATGEHWFLATVVFQTLATALCLFMVYQIARRFWPRTSEPVLAVALMAIDGPFMMEMLSLRQTVWFTLGLLLAGWLLVRPGLGALGAAFLGICLACVYLARPTGLIFVGLTLAFLVWNCGVSRKGAWVGSIALAAALITIAPWQAYTYQVFGKPGFFPVSTNWFNLAKATDPDFAKISPWIDPDLLDLKVLRTVGKIAWQDERAKDAFWKTLSLSRVRQSPQSMVFHVWANVAEFLSPIPVPIGTGKIRQVGASVVVENFRPDWADIAFAPVSALFLFGGFLGTKSFIRNTDARRAFALWVAIVFLAFLGAHAVTFVKTRYRLPLEALLAIPTAEWLAASARRRQAAEIDPEFLCFPEDQFPTLTTAGALLASGRSLIPF